MDDDLLVSDSDSANIKRQLASLRVSAMNILSIREHSIAELRTKLKRKLKRKLELKKSASEQQLIVDENSAELIENVLQQLIADNLLNEVRFTESFIRYRISKGSGPIKIRHELNERGISSELINDSLDSSYEFWHEYIAAVHSKRFGDKIPDDYKQQTKHARFLYQRGFSGEYIRRFFNQY